jgi:hypothetical protein
MRRKDQSPAKLARETLSVTFLLAGSAVLGIEGLQLTDL